MAFLRSILLLGLLVALSHTAAAARVNKRMLLTTLAELQAAYPDATAEQLAQLAGQAEQENAAVSQQNVKNAEKQADDQARIAQQAAALQATQAAVVAQQQQTAATEAAASTAAAAEQQAATAAAAAAAATAAATSTASAATTTPATTTVSSASGTWSGITINRYGDYSAFGQGSGTISTVSCTGQISSPGGPWAAMNFKAFGLSSLPCGMGLTVTNSATGASVFVTVVDGGGSTGLDLDNTAYYAVVPAGTDGPVGGFTVSG